MTKVDEGVSIYIVLLTRVGVSDFFKGYPSGRMLFTPIYSG